MDCLEERSKKDSAEERWKFSRTMLQEVRGQAEIKQAERPEVSPLRASSGSAHT